jgi:O-antigen/teichoic acid export membrane protein
MTPQAAPTPAVSVGTFRQRVLQAGRWSLTGFVISQGIRFATNLMMTRLLAPEMFGVMSVAQMIMVGMALFSDLGLKANVIQSQRGRDGVFLNTVWVTQIAVGCLIALCAVAVGGALFLAQGVDLFPSGSAYTSPELPYVVAVLGLGMVISSLESTAVPEATRGLAVGRVVRVQLLAQLASVLAMLTLATVSRSVWVLVIGGFVGSITGTVLSHKMLPGNRNRFEFDPIAFREIVRFGKWIFLSSAAGFLGLAADKILLAAFVSASTLGVYAIAGLLVFAAEQVLNKLVAEVAFPALSEVARERRRDLKRTVYRFYVPLATLSYAAVAMLVVAGDAIVDLLYDTRYRDAGWMLQILAGILLAVPIRIHAQCFLALGYSRWHSHFAIMRLVTVLIALPVAFYLFGLIGAVFGAVLSHVCVIPMVFYYAARCQVFDIRKELLPVVGFIPGAALGALAVYAISAKV